MRLLRVAPARQTALDLELSGPDIASAVSTAMAAERGWWRLPESARVEVIALLARLIARGVLVEDPPSGGTAVPPIAEATVKSASESGRESGRSDAGERGE